MQFLLGTLKKLKTENGIALQLAKYDLLILSSPLYIIYAIEDFIGMYFFIDYFFFFFHLYTNFFKQSCGKWF